MPGVLQVYIGDQHAKRDDFITIPHTDWLDGSVKRAIDEYTSLLAAAKALIGSLQNPNRSKAFDYPQYATLRKEWFAISRNVTKVGAIGQNTITPTFAQIEDLFTSWANKTGGNNPDQQITRAKFATFDPVMMGANTKNYLWVPFDRDFSREEANTWGGKHREAVTGDEPEPEHSPKWIHYPDDLVALGHIKQKRKLSDSFSLGTKDDVRDPGRIIEVAIGRPDIIIRTRTRLPNGTVLPIHRIDAGPVHRRRQ